MGTESRGVDSAFAFLGGIVVGAIAGVLFAPQSGKDTREQLREQAEKAAGRLRDATESVRESISEVAGNARRAVHRVAKETGMTRGEGGNNPAEGM